jgi:hypothetical protein
MLAPLLEAFDDPCTQFPKTRKNEEENREPEEDDQSCNDRRNAVERNHLAPPGHDWRT